MPTYEYRCAKCGEHVEVFQSFSEAPLSKHKSCGGKLAKVISPVGIVLKGSGFYRNDSRDGRSKKRSTTASSSSDSSSSSSSESSSSSSDSSSSKSSGSDSSSKSSEAKTA